MKKGMVTTFAILLAGGLFYSLPASAADNGPGNLIDGLVGGIASAAECAVKDLTTGALPINCISLSGIT
jgi:hypothetical protein